MFRDGIKGAIVGIIVGLMAGCTTHASPPVTNSAPGLEPYTPTRLEWLHVEAQTELSENAPCYTVNIARRVPDTIVVVVPFKRCMSQESARAVGVQSAEAVRLLAQGHGWRS